MESKILLQISWTPGCKKRFHRRLHQTWTVETAGSVFVAIKLPLTRKKYIHVYSIGWTLINSNELGNQLCSPKENRKLNILGM